MASNSSSIQVVVRLRPMNDMEKKHSTLPVIKASTADRTVTVIKGQGARQARSSFSFDNVFTAFSTQEEVFEATLKPVIADVMLGYESTIFAYGQTGTGKTHTMEGSLSSPELYGIIPRSAQAIFEAIKKPDIESTSIKCSYLEIYNEDLVDLLADEDSDESSMSQQSNGQKTCLSAVAAAATSTPSKKKKTRLEIMEGPDGPFCRGLTEVTVDCASDVLKLMHKAQQLRKVGETKMNRHSSRSHCLFTIKVEATRRLKDGSTIDFCGKLHMVDLAGSECAKSAGFDKGVSGNEQVARERERMNINRSLLTLGRVIKLLKEQTDKGGGKKNSNVRIPYRDSKLTRILQESLGGRCKTLIVATLSPSITAIEESLSTLHYAQSANGIINKPISCSKMSLSSSNTFSSDTVSTDPNSVDTWHEMECRLEYMQSQVEEAQAALARKHLQQQELVDRAEKAEADLLAVEAELFDARQENIKLEKNVIREREQKEALALELHKTEIALKKTAAILEATQHTEVCLTNEAHDILRSLEQSIQDGEALYTQLSNAREDVIQKREITKKFHAATIELLTTAMTKLEELSTREKDNKNEIANLASEGFNREEKVLTSNVEFLKVIKKDVTKLISFVEHSIDGDSGMKRLLNDMSTDIERNSNLVTCAIDEGEESLRSDLGTIQKQLVEYSAQIQQMDSDFISSCLSVTSSMESKIMESKTMVSTFMASALESIRSVNDSHAKTHKQLVSVLNYVLNSTTEASSNISEKAGNQRDKLVDSLVSFRNGMKFDNIRAELQEQESFLKNQGSAHFNSIEELRNMMKSQHSSYELAAAKQKQLQDETLRQITKDLQDILTQGMDKLVQFSMNQFQEFDERNQTMLKANDNVKSSANKILSGIEETSEKLQNQVTLCRQNDNNFIMTAEETTTVLEEVLSASCTHKSNIKTIVNEGRHNLKEVDNHMKAMHHTTIKMRDDYASYEQFVSKDAIENTTVGVNILKDATINLSNYAKGTIIPNVHSNIDHLLIPRSEFRLNTMKSIDSMNDSVRLKSQAMVKTMDNQTAAAKDFMKQFNSNHLDYVNCRTQTVQGKMLDHKQKLIQATERHLLSCSKIGIECSSILESTKGQVGDFSITSMQCNDDVKPLREKVKFSYNSNFTSTPDEMVIVGALNLPSEEKMVLNDVVIDEDSFSMKSKGESNTSISDMGSQVSLSLPCPPMTVNSMCMDKENIDIGNERSRPKSRPRTGKRRAYSKPRASNKRVNNLGTPMK